MLTDRGVAFQNGLPANFASGTVAFHVSPDEFKHADFVTDAWVKDPLRALLRRVSGFSRTGSAKELELKKK
jgi:hypothetical protein